MYLAAFGGWYFDTDYRVLKPIDDAMLMHACVLPISRSSAEVFRLGNAVMGSVPRHPFWGDFLEEIFAESELTEILEDRVEKITGPEGLTDFFLKNRSQYSDVFLPERSIFHPQLTMSGLSWDKSPATVGVHLCWGSWRSKGPLGRIRAVTVRKITSL
jgi:mannosyltransferase OCH1-like enzyme